MSIDELQRELIARQLGVNAADVTADFLDKYLEKNVYPNVRLATGSAFGGYDNSHLRVLTRDEFDRIRVEAERLFDQAVQQAV